MPQAERAQAMSEARAALGQALGEPVEEREERIEAVPEPEDAPETPQEAADAPEGDGEGREPTAAEIRSINDLAREIGADPEWLYGLTMGEGEGALSLAKLREQISEQAQAQAQLAQEREQAERLRHQYEVELNSAQEMRSQYSNVIDEANRQMMLANAEYDRIDWETLDRTDPGLSANKKQQLLSQYVAAKERLEGAQQAHQQAVFQHMGRVKQWHDSKILESIPEWRDPEVARREVPELVNWARQAGFSDEELSGVVDFRHRTVLRKAWLYDKMQAEKKKLVKSGLKAIPAGKGITRKNIDKARESDLIKKARESRNPADKKAALREVFKNQGWGS
jgi:hypothetical protein